MDVPDWLGDRVEVTADGCWRYKASKPNRWGYPVVHASPGVKELAHRYVYKRLVGPIPAGRDLGHTCHDRDPDCPGGPTCPHRACCNPDHVEPQTKSENYRTRVGSRSRNGGRCVNGHPVATGERCVECCREGARAWYASNRGVINQRRRERRRTMRSGSNSQAAK